MVKPKFPGNKERSRHSGLLLKIYVLLLSLFLEEISDLCEKNLFLRRLSRLFFFLLLADADQLEAYVPQHSESIMSGDVTAVEALPKKKSTYNDEIDAIELPEYMQARKSVKDDQPEIPGLPEI